MRERRGRRSQDEAALSLRYRLIGGLLILLFLALFTLAVLVFVWQRLGLPPQYLYAGLVFLILADLLLLGLFADYRLRLLVLRPVRSMVEGSERIALGEEAHRLQGSQTIELTRLATAVNEMAERLIQNQQTLAENVASLDATNRQLSDAHSRLVRADKLASMGRLAAGVAHEVGNPLGAIMGYAELGRRGGAAEEEWLEGISHEAKRIDGIIRGLLDYAKPKAASTRTVDVNGIVARTVELVQIQGRFRNVAPQLLLADDLPPVRADQSQLEQVLVNLLLNAADAIDETGSEGKVEIATRLVTVARSGAAGSPRRRREDPVGVDYSHLRRLDMSADPGPSPQLREGEPAVEISVHDSGPGIDPTETRRIFDPFYTTKEPGHGTGLGLPISARLVEGMGGTMEAVASDGPGATFRILLPVEPEEEE